MSVIELFSYHITNRKFLTMDEDTWEHILKLLIGVTDFLFVKENPYNNLHLYHSMIVTLINGYISSGILSEKSWELFS